MLSFVPFLGKWDHVCKSAEAQKRWGREHWFHELGGLVFLVRLGCMLLCFICKVSILIIALPSPLKYLEQKMHGLKSNTWSEASQGQNNTAAI